MKNHSIAFNTWTEQWDLLQTPVLGSVHRVCVVFTLLSLCSEWSQGFHIHVSYEVRPSPDVAVFVKALAVLSLGLLCFSWTFFKQCRTLVWWRHWRRMGDILFWFFLFLVQYAVHKSLAHKILRFLSISFVVKWVHCHFVFVFFIKILWIIDMTCVCFLLLSIPKLSFFVWSLFDRKDQCTHIQTRWRYV